MVGLTELVFRDDRSSLEINDGFELDLKEGLGRDKEGDLLSRETITAENRRWNKHSMC